MYEEIFQYLQSQKGKNLALYDISGEKSLNDYVLIQHFTSVVENKKFAENFMQQFKIEVFPEGYNKGEWIVFDLDKVVVHSFILPMREKYNLDKLWQNKKVDIKNKK